MISQTKGRVLITGASSGIGRSTAIAFAQSGFDLALVSRNQSKLAEVIEQVTEYGIHAKAYAFDLAETEQVKDQIAAVVEDVGAIDILINNAGMGYTNYLADTPLQDWQRVLDLNLTSVFQCIQAVLPSMRQQQRGTIINVCSIASHQTFPNWGAYCASKFGLLALTKTLAAEERTHRIRVVAISPGSVNTSIWDTDTVEADFDRSQMLSPESVAQTILYTALLPEQAVIESLVLMSNAGTF